MNIRSKDHVMERIATLQGHYTKMWNIKLRANHMPVASQKSSIVNFCILFLECLTKLIVFCLQSINQFNVLEPMSLQFVVKLKFNQDDLKLMFKKVSMKKKKGNNNMGLLF